MLIGKMYPRQLLFQPAQSYPTARLFFGNRELLLQRETLRLVGEVMISQGIIGFNEETQQASQENITYWQAPTSKPCYRITTNSKRILECSDDHPILYSKVSNFRKSFRDENGKRNYQCKVS